jgi:hypothetical protein
VCPGAAGQQLGQLRRLLSWNLAPEQIGYFVLHLEKGLLRLVGENQRFVIHFGDRLLTRRFYD